MNHTLFIDSISTVLFLVLCLLEMHTCPLRTEMEFTPALRKGTEMYFDLKEFGKRMKEARNHKGLTQERLAELLGVDRLHVNRLENGAKACSIDLLIDISTLLDVSTDYLLKGTPVISSDARMKMLSVLKELTAIVNEL